MIVVSDTSVLSGLIKIGQLTLLEKVFKHVVIPTKVADELNDLGSFGYDLSPFLTAQWIDIKSVTNLSLVWQLESTINRGEAEAIVLAIELQADLILIDEKLGRQVAENHGLSVTGLIGVLMKAKQMGEISSIKMLMDDLIKANFRISKTLYSQVLQMAGEQP
jgi:uncharacterized protein